jgi:hypothetical protein
MHPAEHLNNFIFIEVMAKQGTENNIGFCYSLNRVALLLDDISFWG